MIVSFVVPGLAIGQGRPRFAAGHAYTDKATRTKQGVVTSLAMDAMAGRPPIEGPVILEVTVEVEVLASFSKKKRALALDGELLPAKKPDLTNIIKLIEDGMNAVVFKDDAQIVSVAASKYYADVAKVLVSVITVGHHDADLLEDLLA